MTNSAYNQQSRQSAPRQHGVLYNVLLGWPMALTGMVLASLLLSLIIEFIGIAFFWPEQGASHSEAVMRTELGYLSSEFKRSLIMAEPSVTLVRWITAAYELLLVESGAIEWFSSQSLGHSSSGNAKEQKMSRWGFWFVSYMREYLLAAIYVTVVTLVRVTILVLSVPLFILVVIVALVEGLGRRDLRRYGAAYESSFVYHHAKRAVKPVAYVPCMIYLSWPAAVYPNLLLLPAALLFGVTITATVSSFKKYL